MAGNKNSGRRDGLPRTGAGRKPKSLEEKLLSGNPGKRKLQVVKFPEAVEFNGQDMPPPREFLSAMQKNGKEMIAVEIYGKTWAWLKDRKCDQLVTAELLEQYAMSVSRWIQCEECISEFGFLAKHPTTGNAIPSPYIAMAQSFMKQTNAIWYQVFQVVKENCAEDFGGSTPQDDIMSYLLTKGRD